jgi:hypothetical protein
MAIYLNCKKSTKVQLPCKPRSLLHKEQAEVWVRQTGRKDLGVVLLMISIGRIWEDGNSDATL